MKRFLSTVSVAASLVVFQSVTYAQSAADLLTPSVQSSSLEPSSLEPSSLEPSSLEPSSLEPSSLEPSSLESSSLERSPEADSEQIAAQPALEVEISDEDFLPPAIEGDWRVDLLPDLARESGCASSSSGIVVVCVSDRH
ncbi:MAG: hypothetical protein WA883_16490 [Phormidesmis sp.]